MTYVDRIARIHLALDDTAIWREIEVPLTTSLRGVHQIIQAAMGFKGYHLFQFEITDRRYGLSNPEWEEVLDAKNLKLGALVDRGFKTFAYIYDFGDNWRHTLTIQAISDADPTIEYPKFLDGAKRAPPEDVGGIPGFEEFLLAVGDQHDEDHARMVEWYGSLFDPDDIDQKGIESRMATLARRRTLGKAGYGKSWGRSH